MEVRLQAADSLGRLAGEKAVPALEEALENDHAMVHGVIPGLGHAGGAGVPLLIKMLKDEIDNPDGESRVADLIVYSLKNTGDRRAIQPLIDIIKRPADYKTDWPSTQKIAAQVLRVLRFENTTIEPFTIDALCGRNRCHPCRASSSYRTGY